MTTVISKPEITNAEPRTRTQAFVELTKIRISVMVLLTFACAAFLAAITTATPISVSVMLCGLIGMLLIASSGNAMNMYIERYSDYLMPRTANRPLPSQALSSTEVVMFVSVSLGVGLAFLFAGVNWQTGLCGIANWILYVCVYTPLKRVTPWNTEIGAVAGAMPVIMGALATTQTVGVLGWSFFGVLFLWQFPHFFAIAWKYRDQYEMGGLKMLTVTEPTGLAAGIKSVITGLLLIVTSLVPLTVMTGQIHMIIFAVMATFLGLFYLRPAIEFCRSRNDATARKLLHASLLYLPAYMTVLVAVFLI